MARPAYRVTPDHVKTVRAMASYGVPHEAIASVLGIDAKTLRKHYKHVLAVSGHEANAMVAQGLFQAATSWMQPPEPGRKPPPLTREATLAMIFWLKCRAGWTEKVSVSSTVNAKVDSKTEGHVSVTATSDSDRRALDIMAQLERAVAGSHSPKGGLE